jgi:hypothetical protein
MLDIATSSSSDGFEIAKLGHRSYVLAQVVLTAAGKSAPVRDEIKASRLAPVDTGAAGSVISEGFVARTSGLDIIEVSRASIFMGGKDAGFRFGRCARECSCQQLAACGNGAVSTF